MCLLLFYLLEETPGSRQLVQVFIGASSFGRLVRYRHGGEGDSKQVIRHGAGAVVECLHFETIPGGRKKVNWSTLGI